MTPGINDYPHKTAIVSTSKRIEGNKEPLTAFPINFFLQPLEGHNVLNLQPVNQRELCNSKLQTRGSPEVSTAYFNHLKEGIAQYNTDFLVSGHFKELLSIMKPTADTNGASSPLSPVNNFDDEKLARHNEMIITVETRLNQIREYIKTTGTMMESLKKSSDPRAKTQHEKLGRMVEDLYDSETKLSKLLQQYRSQGTENGNNEGDHDKEVMTQEHNIHLYKKMEESQKKLTQLQEHQSQLVGMQKAMTESLNEARQLRNNLMLLDPEEPVGEASPEAEAQMLALVGKLSQLQAKKQNMDQLIAELNATEISEQCTSEVKSIKEKEIELEGLKAQLAHLKTLMDNATKGKENNDDEEPYEQSEDGEDEKNNDALSDSENPASAIKPKIEEIQAVTKELKEQAALLQAARAEVAALKKSYNLRSSQNTASNSPTNSTPLPTHSNELILNQQPGKSNDNSESHQAHQEETIRKDQNRVPSANGTLKTADWGSRRNSNVGQNRNDNLNYPWPPTVPAEPQERGVDENSLPENLDVGLHFPFDNGYPGNWIGVSYPPVIPPSHAGTVASAEYYRQLFLGSQAQQIQMMNNTIQNCCQMLHSQQREMQLMRRAIIDLQTQLHQFQTQDSNKNKEHRRYENGLQANSTCHFEFLGVDPVPNLPTTINSPPTADVSEEQQNNKQVPLIYNYQDILRSRSMPNTSTPIPVDSTSDLSTISGLSNHSLAVEMDDSSVYSYSRKEKPNHSSESLLQSSSHLVDPLATSQLQEDEEGLPTDQILIKDENIYEEENSFYRMLFTNGDPLTKKDTPYQFEKLSDELKETLYSFVMSNVQRTDFLLFLFKKLKTISEDEYLRLCLLRSLCKLEDAHAHQNTLTETTDQTISESNTSHSSDEYEVNAQVSAILNTTNDSQSSLTEMLVPLQRKSISSPILASTFQQLNLLIPSVDISTSCSSISPIQFTEDTDDMAEDKNKPDILEFQNLIEDHTVEIH